MMCALLVGFFFPRFFWFLAVAGVALGSAAGGKRWVRGRAAEVWGGWGGGSCLAGNIKQKHQQRKHTWGGWGQGGDVVGYFFALKGKIHLS